VLYAACTRHLDQDGLGIVESGQRRGVLLHLSDGGIDAALQPLSVGVVPLGVPDEACSHQADYQVDPDAGISEHNPVSPGSPLRSGDGTRVSAQRVLVVVVPVQMVRMAVMQVVDVAVMLHRNMAAGRRVPVIAIGAICNKRRTTSKAFRTGSAAGAASRHSGRSSRPRAPDHIRPNSPQRRSIEIGARLRATTA